MASKSLWGRASEAAKYSLARPSHPKEIVNSVVRFLKEKYCGPMIQAVDVGCGTGISTRNLFGEFQSVVGCDVSNVMIEQARDKVPHGSVRFVMGSADQLPVGDNSTQLILAGRSVHYFNTENFFREAERVLVPGGVVCYYSVHYPTISYSENSVAGDGINRLLWRHLTHTLADYWPVNPYNGLTVDHNRRDYYVKKVVPPYAEVGIDESVVSHRCVTLLDISRELETYGPFVTLRERMGDSAADKILAEFLQQGQQLAQQENPQLTATDSFFLVMSRKPLNK